MGHLRGSVMDELTKVSVDRIAKSGETPETQSLAKAILQIQKSLEEDREIARRAYAAESMRELP